MCLLLVKQKGSVVSTEEIEKAWKRNSDGASLMWLDKKDKENPWRYVRGIMTLGELKERESLWQDKDIILTMHLRWASPGTGRGQDLCHLFNFKKGDGPSRFLLHNGNVRFVNPNSTSSDTKDFAENYLSHMEDKEVATVLNKMAEKGYGKFVVFTRKGPHIFDNNKGIYENGVYFSNIEHRNATVRTVWPNAHEYGYSMD